MEAPVNAMIKKVSEDYERMKFNTAIAAMMSYVNEIYATRQRDARRAARRCCCA